MPVTSIFLFSHSVFKSPLSQGDLKSGLCGERLNLRNLYCFYECEEKVYKSPLVYQLYSEAQPSWMLSDLELVEPESFSLLVGV